MRVLTIDLFVFHELAGLPESSRGSARLLLLVLLPHGRVHEILW